LEDETIYHPNIQGVRSTKAVIDYILKHADYISKYKIDNLQIAQIIIEKEIKEGRYITNNKLAKEYFKTYTLYNKRLIDWKTKIKEQYYKSLGKPFVEFHYGDKITQLYYSTFLKILSRQQQRLEIKGSKELNYIKHVIITSNYSLKELYRKDDYNRNQLDWCFDAIWNYKKSQDTFSERKYERNPYHKQQYRQYLNSINYFQYFEENWKTVNNLDITKNIFHNNYSSISFNNNYQDSEINNDNYLTIEKIRTILAKRNKNNQLDSETKSLNIEHQFETTNNLKEIDNEIEVIMDLQLRIQLGNDLVTSRLKPQDLPIIRICLNEDNQYISADNRRLYCYQQAIQKEKSLKIIENKIWNNVVVLYLARPNKICRENGKVW
ncbi:13712_t:CDS:2, partial [Gigaspora rosea]